MRPETQAMKVREATGASSVTSPATLSLNMNVDKTPEAPYPNHSKDSIAAPKYFTKLPSPPASPTKNVDRKKSKIVIKGPRISNTRPTPESSPSESISSGTPKNTNVINAATRKGVATLIERTSKSAPSQKGVATLIKRSQNSVLANAGTSVNKKRKHDEDTSGPHSPAKKPEARNNYTIIRQPSELINGKAGCYQNAVLHALSSIPAFVALEKGKRFEGAETGIAPVFARMMRQMAKSDDARIETRAFRRACGEVCGKQYNGQTEEDAEEFMQQLVEQLQKECPDLKLLAQFDVEFVRKANCKKCGAAKEIAEKSDLSLSIELNARKPLAFDELLRKQLHNTSDFEYRKCDQCYQTGTFCTSAETAKQRMRSAPSFLKVIIPRHDPFGRGLNIKNRTKVDLPVECQFVDENGDTLTYELVSAMGHDGRTPTHGHWVALRKVDERWFQCDSAEFEGVERMTGPDFSQKGTQVSLCLFKKL